MMAATVAAAPAGVRGALPAVTHPALLARGRPNTAVTTRAATDRQSADETGDSEILDALRDVAARRGVPPARVALSWLLGRPAVTAPIIGATRTGHLDDAVAALDLTLDADEAAALERPYRPRNPFGY